MRIDEFITELWVEDPPSSAMTTLQTYIYKIRKSLAECGAADLLRTTPQAGYVFTLPDSATDLHRFETLVDEGRSLLDDDPEGAAATLSEALATWRGPALMDVDTGELLYAYVARLEEIRLRALELRVEADLALGRHIELLSELKMLVIEHPLHERFHAALMTALNRVGRRYEALEVFQTLRGNLTQHLNLEPGPELNRLHQSLLSSRQPLVTAPRPRPIVVVSERDPVTPPAQLPPDIADFVGRSTVLDHMTRRLPEGPVDRTAAPIMVITGAPGVGKTALAMHFAQRIRNRFSGGQLFAALRGSSKDPCRPTVVLGEFLRALHVPESQIPSTADERGKLFRSVTAGLRLLIVLDDAPDMASVAALLPGDPNCQVVVTSRRGLRGLAGVVPVELNVLEPAEGVELLAMVLGRGRVEGERRDAERLVELAGQLPLALRTISCRLAAMPDFPLAEMACQLTQSYSPLNELRFGELDVRSRYESSYESLPDPSEQAAFRLLSMLPTADFTAEMAADFLGCELTKVELVLETILDRHLLEVVDTADGEVRYAYPHLIRLFARARLASSIDAGQLTPWWRRPGGT